jgi:hypothetical protein
MHTMQTLAAMELPTSSQLHREDVYHNCDPPNGLVSASRATGKKKWKTKTYNRRDSQMVTHSSTSRPVQCLCMAERTGCPVFTDLWSYVSVRDSTNNMNANHITALSPASRCDDLAQIGILQFDPTYALPIPGYNSKSHSPVLRPSAHEQSFLGNAHRAQQYQS